MLSKQKMIMMPIRYDWPGDVPVTEWLADSEQEVDLEFLLFLVVYLLICDNWDCFGKFGGVILIIFINTCCEDCYSVCYACGVVDLYLPFHIDYLSILDILKYI